MGVLTTNSKLKNMMTYLRVYHMSKWNAWNSLIIQWTRVGTARALNRHYIGSKNKTHGKEYGITWGDMRDTLRTWEYVVNLLRLNQNTLKTLNPTLGYEQKLGRFIGSLWAMNPGHSTTNEKFAWTKGGRGGADVWHKQVPLKQTRCVIHNGFVINLISTIDIAW